MGDKITADEARKIAEDLFVHYPNAKGFYVTSDGQAFEIKNLAEDHQRKVNKKAEVMEVLRPVAGVEEVEEAEKDEQAGEEKEMKPPAELSDTASPPAPLLEEKGGMPPAELTETNPPAELSGTEPKATKKK